MNFGTLAEQVRKSTVQILTPEENSSGSGIVLTNGRVLTNAHVIRGRETRVQLWSGEVVAAAVQRRDDRKDLAVVQMKHDNGWAATLRERPASPGEWVMAIGNPLGFVGAVSAGVIHAVGPLNGLGRRDWVQAGVRLAPGNSGGPLVDASGQILGINTMIYHGLGLAIPTAAVQRFLSRAVSPLRLGVTIRPVRAGLLVLEIAPDSPAQVAALLPGDIIVGVNEFEVRSSFDLADALETTTDTARVRFLRGGSPRVRETVARTLVKREAA